MEDWKNSGKFFISPFSFIIKPINVDISWDNVKVFTTVMCVKENIVTSGSKFHWTQSLKVE